MVKKVTGDSRDEKKELRPKRLKLKSLHRGLREQRAELEKLPPDELPAASSSNAARQVRSRLSNTFPVNWLELHKERPEDERDSE